MVRAGAHAVGLARMCGAARRGARARLNVTLPFTDRVALVRLMGGWKGAGGAPNASDDVVASVDVGARALRYAWDRLWRRVDPIVFDAGLEPMVVFDNVPWGFTRGGGATDDATAT